MAAPPLLPGALKLTRPAPVKATIEVIEGAPGREAVIVNDWVTLGAGL